ncbi:MAG TPA: IS630 family transposase [Desulfobacteria bacterium]|nr:IS630 family transposase [Desulfobacteria bacterium]
MTWNLPRGEDFLPDVSVDFLEKRLTHERRAKPRLRLLAALHRKQGWSLDEIAAPLGLHRRSVHDILWRFVERGLDAAYDAPRSGRHPYLTEEEQADLRERLIAGPQANGFREGFWTTRMVLYLVEKQYHRKYTREHMTRLLHKLGFSSQKPRPQNAKKPSDEEIQRFKKKLVEWYPTT